ncbi:aspartate beta-hydroxylase domain-containing protein 2 isoform X2 [Alosa sapidissima]|uniref:aspartate beta-hydroxylase domain-containing protein 2 isoform X2 n=1 Tax=Alosa sapidissima TaxID=34773 RepID=UPI001C08AA45|nr:aspartate beta-hydroxylase domain-containing protein 2 isoform X2 [Alosa sapidissima]
MWWNLEQLTLPPVTGLLSLASPPVTGLLWSLLLLFLWYCYRLGSEPSPRGRSHTLPRQTSSPEPRPSTEANAPITMETSDGQGVESYLTPVLSHALFPVSASAGSRKLYEALQEYAKRYSWSGMARIHRGLRHQSRVSERFSVQRPHLFYLPDVPSIPFFPRDAHRHDIELLEASYPIILAEFQAVYQRGIDPKLGWMNQGPKGQAVFPLYNAGVCVASNCRACPCSYRVLLALRTFISSNALGAAGFWLLPPGVCVGGAYGPTNTRLRCHLGLQTPAQCELVVGGEPQCWSEGHCLLVDDSFLHTISHKGSAEDGPRVIFSVDLWHPNVAAAERQALDYIFAPEQ